ncbi:polysaccharide export protein [Pseudomonas costantinii]|uniref:Polysaccharide biosynthesis protein n=1 Tax=Pseudomonas costantinii TaxID=168469 RepID=A0A1S2V546_9PSED|nr:polysaccharide biosynthesis/export family protein [Pseudomonas costantinii]NVZ22315.1 polysaccharide export protein [Pseudomonas costantinii]NVZ72354.1 polysaccharide export protein [Pseudomonas costantinii]OIN53832.1 polysaccharide biosynthesis protein [Pseudomonas costantinii]SEE43029.1 protein involved in polysaccharide export, contains SLBB domain of the beta-grasp fold [Pseudomonas costantinii]
MKTTNRRSRLTLLSLLSASIWLAGCSTPARVPLPDNDTLKAGHQAALTLADLPPAQVLILAGDSLRIVRDAQEPAAADEMTVFVVRPDGVISMPNIGRVKAASRTPEDLGKEITEKYKRIYREPTVTVNIASAPSNKVFIGGAVPNPAFFDLAGSVSVEQALLSSGGVLPSADSSNIALMRTGANGKYNMYFISLSDMLTDPNHPRVPLQRGDLIYVPQSKIGATVEAVDMYFTRLFPINKGIGIGLNYDLNNQGVKNSGNTTNTSTTIINP